MCSGKTYRFVRVSGLGVGVALEFGRIIAGLDGQFGLVDVQKLGNPKNMNFSIVVGYKF